MTKDKIISGLKMTMELFLFDPSTGETCEPDDLNELNRTTYDACKGAVELLQNEPHWIPVTERLPEKNGEYIVTIQCEHVDGWDDYVTGFAEWDVDDWHLVSYYPGQIKVVAYMPLPEPFKGVTS